MLVKTTVRDEEITKAGIKSLLLELGIYFGIFLGALVILGRIGEKAPEWMQYICTGIVLICIILLIPVCILLIVKANKLYKSSFVERNYEYTALCEKIYVEGKKMHVNYNKEVNEIYVHDIEENEENASVTFYGTIKGDEANKFMKFLKENNVGIEKE
ncbi:hypothetical protein [Eubacterium sp.]